MQRRYSIAAARHTDERTGRSRSKMPITYEHASPYLCRGHSLRMVGEQACETRLRYSMRYCACMRFAWRIPSDHVPRSAARTSPMVVLVCEGCTGLTPPAFAARAPMPRALRAPGAPPVPPPDAPPRLPPAASSRSRLAVRRRDAPFALPAPAETPLGAPAAGSPALERSVAAAEAAEAAGPVPLPRRAAACAKRALSASSCFCSFLDPIWIPIELPMGCLNWVQWMGHWGVHPFVKTCVILCM